MAGSDKLTEKNLNKLKKAINEVSEGIRQFYQDLERAVERRGQQFERLLGPPKGCNLEWIKKYLGVEIDFSRKWKDCESEVDPPKTEFTTDIYCADPFIIGGCEVFLDEAAFCRLKTLVRIQDYFYARSRRKCHLYFFTYEISTEIEQDVLSFCNQRQITLVVSHHV